jgi:hypothetical protein
LRNDWTKLIEPRRRGVVGGFRGAIRRVSVMSDKPRDRLNELDLLIRDTIRPGMAEGTLLIISFVSGFERFNTRPYHNYETWGQGYVVQEGSIRAEREDLDDALKTWASRRNADVPSEPLSSPSKPNHESGGHIE